MGSVPFAARHGRLRPSRAGKTQEDHKEKIMAHSINPDSCVGCGACKDTCPVEAISQDGDKCKVNPDACVDCGACEGACPTGAIAAS